MNATLKTKLEAFAQTLQNEQIARLVKDELDCEANLIGAKTRIIPGRKYTKVDVGNGGRFMVENDTEIIFGVKAYGQVHRGNAYGTLDTVNEWDFGGYYPRKLAEPKTPVETAAIPEVPVVEEKKAVEPVVGMGTTFRLYTDRTAGTIIEVSANKKKIVVQQDKATLLNGFQSGEKDALHFSPGGFFGHTSGEQRYSYERDPEGATRVYTLRHNGTWRPIGTGAREQGSILYLGHRSENYDFNF